MFVIRSKTRANVSTRQWHILRRYSSLCISYAAWVIFRANHIAGFSAMFPGRDASRCPFCEEPRRCRLTPKVISYSVTNYSLKYFNFVAFEAFYSVLCLHVKFIVEFWFKLE